MSCWNVLEGAGVPLQGSAGTTWKYMCVLRNCIFTFLLINWVFKKMNGGKEAAIWRQHISTKMEICSAFGDITAAVSQSIRT